MAAAMGAVAGQAQAAELRASTSRAFDDYIHKRERRLAEERLSPGSPQFLWLDGRAERRAAAREGRVAIEAAQKKNPMEAPDGLIHDWAAGVFIPSASLALVLARVQDYDHHKRYYAPEVMDSKLLRRQGDRFHIYYRLMKKKVITAVLNSEHTVRPRMDGGADYPRPSAGISRKDPAGHAPVDARLVRNRPLVHCVQ